ncbi:MAG: NAD(P)-dependent oxidoreductase [Terrimicrobiaceae bacterium]
MKVVLEKSIYSRAVELFDTAAKIHGLEWCLIEPLEEEKALAFHQAGAGAFVIGTKKYSEEFFSALRPGTLVQRFGVGYSSVPTDLCKENSLHVGYTPGVLEAAVAEHAMALILALSRTICTFDREMKAGQWNKIEGTELRGKTLALIGFGRIARETAFIARNGFRMRIAAYGARPAMDPAGRELSDDYFTDLDACLARADYVSLHLPDTPQTAGFVNSQFLKKMKPSAFLINTARGSLLNEADLIEALKSRTIAGAALDVFVEEPYGPSGPDFRTLGNCILTPHCASNTLEANSRMAEICIANCIALATGKTDELVLIPEHKR